jgi:type IX secretion system PorP/SprF family membrane protein
VFPGFSGLITFVYSFTLMKTKNKTHCLTLLFVVILTADVDAQLSNSPAPFNSYYYDYKIANPAFVGAKSKHLINTVYSGIAGVSSYRVLYASYERNIESIKSGIGGLFLYNELGPVKHVYGGLLYSYRLTFNETSGLRFGTQVFYQSRTVDYDYYRYINPGDLLIPSGTETNQSVNLDLGTVYYSPAITVGASLKNVMKRDEETTTFNILATRKFNIFDGLKAEPSVFFFTDFDDNSLSLNNIFEIRRWVLLGAGYTLGGDSGDFTFNVGLNIKDWVQIITHVYSSGYQTQVGTDPQIETMIRVMIPERE